MSWLLHEPGRPTVLEGSPADAAPGDELLWATEEPDGPAHHAVEVGLVLHDAHRGVVRVLSRDGTELEFATDRVVILLRDLQGLLERSRATAPNAAAERAGRTGIRDQAEAAAGEGR